jgi:hypothetical protein
VEDVVEAASWYEAHAPGLGEQLIDEILAATRRAHVRRVLTRSLPYRIFFSIVGETLYVHAVLHGARHDRRWTERL